MPRLFPSSGLPCSPRCNRRRHSWRSAGPKLARPLCFWVAHSTPRTRGGFVRPPRRALTIAASVRGASPVGGACMPGSSTALFTLNIETGLNASCSIDVQPEELSKRVRSSQGLSRSTCPLHFRSCGTVVEECTQQIRDRASWRSASCARGSFVCTVCTAQISRATRRKKRH